MEAVKLSLFLCYLLKVSEEHFPVTRSTWLSSEAVARLEMGTPLLGSSEAKNIFKNRKNEKLFFLCNGYLAGNSWFFSKPYFSLCPCVSIWISACSGAACLRKAVPFSSCPRGLLWWDSPPCWIEQFVVPPWQSFKGFSSCSPVQ